MVLNKSIVRFHDGEPTNLFSLGDYKNILIDKLLELNVKRIALQDFVGRLIQDQKDFLANEKNEGLKQQIINDVLEKAREAKLII